MIVGTKVWNATRITCVKLQKEISSSHSGPRGGHRPKMWPFFIAIKNIESNYIFHLEFKTFYRIWLSSLVLEISYFKVRLFYQNAGVLFYRFSVNIYLSSSGKMANVTKMMQYGSQNVNIFSWYRRMDNLTYKKIKKIKRFHRLKFL